MGCQYGLCHYFPLLSALTEVWNIKGLIHPYVLPAPFVPSGCLLRWITVTTPLHKYAVTYQVGIANLKAYSQVPVVVFGIISPKYFSRSGIVSDNLDLGSTAKSKNKDKV